MQYYLFENPWPGAILLGGLALFLLWIGLRDGRSGWLFAAGVAAVLGASLFLLDSFVTTPAEEVGRQLERMVEAARRHDAETIIDCISPEYRLNGQTKESLAQLIRREIGTARFRSIRLNGLEIAGNDREVRARFVAIISADYQGFVADRYPVRLALSFERQGETWRITRVQRYDPIAAEKEIPLGER